MNNWYDDEATFLSRFTAAKLENGGEPCVSSEELWQAFNEFKKSWQAKDFLSNIKNFNFDDLESIAKKFQAKARKNRPWQKPCFEYKDGRLYVTYDFFDIVEDRFCALKGFLSNHKFTPALNKTNSETCDAKMKNAARAAALYITKFLASSYIKHQTESQHWPIHLSDTSYIFAKDLGKALELKGTKDYFVGFFGNTYENLLSLLKERNGQVLLSSTRSGNLAFNNLARIISGYPQLDGPQDVTTSEYDDRSFKIKIEDGKATANETKLEFHDPYGEWSDQYSSKNIDLSKMGKSLK